MHPAAAEAGCFAGGLVVGLLLSGLSRGQPPGAAPPAAKPADAARPAVPPPDGKLRIICFGAHPDDCELKAAGVAAMWAAQGHHVKFVSVTNGDIGHWRDAGGPLARRRKAEVEQAAKVLGIATEVMDVMYPASGPVSPTIEDIQLTVARYYKLTLEERYLVMRMIFGGHVDKFDYHQVGLSVDFLAAFLTEAAFVNLRRVASFGLFEDTSAMLFKGVPISLNVVAEKAP